MAKFRKKPVIIDAIQLTEKLFWETYDSKEPVFGQFTFSGSYNPTSRTVGNLYIAIPTLEGTMRADLNDWIIKGIKGEYYPCKEEIFLLTYERFNKDVTAPTLDDAMSAAIKGK